MKTVIITFEVEDNLEQRIKEAGSNLITEGGSVLMKSVYFLRQSSDAARKQSHTLKASLLSDLANAIVLGKVTVESSVE